ncbi:MAG: putative ABC transporter permease [Lachnospiraceae bacterium]|nr:putative ABC transporter permease [Lachnospiraceae bacterium]
MWRNFLKCGIFGWAMELLWSGFHAFRVRDMKLTGKSSLWMFPIYGSASLLAPAMRRLKRKGRNVMERGLIYMSSIYLVEFVSGTLLKSRGMCPWDYSKSPRHYKGVIRLDYAPAWFLVGLAFERMLAPVENGRR